MKILFCLIFAICTVIAVPLGNTIHDESRYVKFLDDNGVLQTIDLEEPIDIELLEDVQRNPANNRYLLYTRGNPIASQTLNADNPNSIILSNFNPQRETVVIAHGWLSHQHTNINPVITNAFLQKGDYNVIVLEWRRLANSGYITAVNGVPAVGRGLGQFLKSLNRITGAHLETMHLVGFSLGAHLVGNAGKELEGKVGRITGLDPAGPLWNLNSNRLKPTDGFYVEAIHTNGGAVGLGIGTAVADVDFFPNGGSSQPGCFTSICDHNRAWDLFAASVIYDHLLGTQCLNMLQVTLNTCRGRILRMGNSDLVKLGSGLYRLTTQRRYPY